VGARRALGRRLGVIPKPRFLGAGAESDARLVELARSGEERAFELIVRRHRKALVGSCRRLGLGEARAEDAVQQAFLSAWLALRRGDEVRELRPWLARIAHNKAVNLLRAGRHAENGGDQLFEQPAPRGGVDDALALRQTLAAVAALPERQREALLLSAVDGRSYEEVASELGVSPGAVRGLLHRARATLRGAVGAASPLALARWASGWLRRASVPAGRAAELASPASGTGGPAGAVKAAAAVTTLALAAGVAVGPLHGLISQSGRHKRHSGAVAAGTALQPGANGGAAHAGPVPTGAARDLAAGGAAPAAGAVTAVPVAGRQVQGGAPKARGEGEAPGSGGGGRPGGEGGGGAAEPNTATSSEPAAAAASSPGAPAPVEAPTTSTPAPEPAPPVAGQPEAPKEPVQREREIERELPGETDDPPQPTGTETPTKKDN
jgi:RNA polymerase sigma factor (sigma-70 family)